MVHSARPLKISASSFASNGCSGAAYVSYALGKRKKDLLKRSGRNPGLRTQLVERANPAHVASGKKNETVASPLRVGELVNGEDERAPLGGLIADHLDDVAGLPKIEAIERLVHQQHVLRRQETDSQQQPAIVALRQRMHTFLKDGLQSDRGYDRSHVCIGSTV